MAYQNKGYDDRYFILIFVAIKICLNLLAIPHFGFHRDEFLHLVLADHLAWGYKEVPPFIALLAKISDVVFGTSVSAARIFPTIAAGLIIFFSGLITLELGGRRFAIALVCLALIFSPAFAASDYLFQPVVFDQLWWVMAAWALIKYTNMSYAKYLYQLGIIVGIGLLTKYTMAFFTFALLAGILASGQRRMLLNKHFLGAAVLALLIFSPNLIWQFQHHLPVFTHMKTLQENQLNANKPIDFITQSLMVNGIALLLWLAGFLMLLISGSFKKYQFVALSFVAIVAFYLVMKGKPYYLFGAYPMLFAAGGVVFERWLKTSGYLLRSVTVVLFIVPNLVLFPIVLPVLSLGQTLAVIKDDEAEMPFIKFITTWEDHKVHPLTQDYADMLGWEDMAVLVNKGWKSLTPLQQQHTQIFADNYGEAGALHHFDKQYHLPEVVSLNSSFALWAPDQLNGRYIIYVDEGGGDNIRSFANQLESYRKIGEVVNPLARERGTAVFLLVHPKPGLDERYKKELAVKRLQ